ncbi:MAG: hypothetical protein KC910_20250 [Candidatus Eremiobacteraeota bacterium]|nr:hypothetical protein [Candidatus Eremiobacteraeota bacterium]
MSGGLNQVLDQLREGGRFVSTGRFTISAQSAREKLARHLEGDRHAFLLKFVQFCYGLEIEEIRVQTSSQGLALWLNPPRRQLDQALLQQALANPFASHDQLYQDLSLCLNGALFADGVRPVLVDFTGGYSLFVEDDAWCLGECPTMDGEAYAQGLILSGTEKSDWKTFARELRATFEEKCRFAPVRCFWDGQEILAWPAAGRRLLSLELITAADHPPFKMRVPANEQNLLLVRPPGSSGDCGASRAFLLPLDLNGPNQMQVVVRGVVRASLDLPGPQVGAQALVAGQNLTHHLNEGTLLDNHDVAQLRKACDLTWQQQLEALAPRIEALRARGIAASLIHPDFNLEQAVYALLMSTILGSFVAQFLTGPNGPLFSIGFGPVVGMLVPSLGITGFLASTLNPHRRLRARTEEWVNKARAKWLKQE